MELENLRLAEHWTLCVYHSSVLYQFSAGDKERLASLLTNLSLERPVWRISAESEEGLQLFSYRDGTAVERFLGAFDAHGRWLCWEQ